MTEPEWYCHGVKQNLWSIIEVTAPEGSMWRRHVIGSVWLAEDGSGWRSEIDTANLESHESLEDALARFGLTPSDRIPVFQP